MSSGGSAAARFSSETGLGRRSRMGVSTSPGKMQHARMPVSRELGVDGLVQGGHSELGCAIRDTRDHPGPLSPRHGRDVDHQTVSLVLHVRHDGPERVECAGEIDVDHAVPVLVGYISETALQRVDAGVVYQDVDPAETLDRAVGQGAYRVPARDVGL